MVLNMNLKKRFINLNILHLIPFYLDSRSYEVTAFMLRIEALDSQQYKKNLVCFTFMWLFVSGRKQTNFIKRVLFDKICIYFL